MKTFLAFLCLVSAAVFARADSPYAGQYYAISYSGDEIVAVTNLKVKSNGNVTGHGYYTDLTSTSSSGVVNNDGTFTLTENAYGQSSSFTGKISTNGKKFHAILSTGVVVKGVRVPTDFPIAGAYYATTDQGAEGLFIATAGRQILGAIYDPDTGDIATVTGEATADGFSGTTDEGVTFQGTFAGKSISGTYDDGEGDEGTFSGERL